MFPRDSLYVAEVGELKCVQFQASWWTPSPQRRGVLQVTH